MTEIPQETQLTQVIRFATYEVDLRAGEVRKGGMRLKLSGQPFEVLAMLLERPGEVVTREELQKRLWPDTFVDVEHSLNTAVNKIREVLGDTADNPRFVETLPRRGYRFVAPVNGSGPRRSAESIGVEREIEAARSAGRGQRWHILAAALLFCAVVVLAGIGWTLYEHTRHAPRVQRTLTRLTFDDGLQIGGTWAPDGRYIAFSSDRGGKFDIWMQQLSGGDAIQITKGPGQNWQPDWSPDGRYIAYRSEEGDGGIFVVPALGGTGQERKVSAFGYYPRWSPDSTRILFQSTPYYVRNRFYIVGMDVESPKEVLQEATENRFGFSAAWHPDGKRVTARVVPVSAPQGAEFWTVPVNGGKVVKTELSGQMAKEMKEAGRTVGSLMNVIDSKFGWAPSGDAIYLELNVKSVTNIWRMRVDPETLQASAIERVTTGTGMDTEVTISPDGKRLLFTGQSRHVCGWLFPFDASRGQVTGQGHAVTSAGLEVNSFSLSRDGKKLAFCANRAGKWELRGLDLPDGKEAAIVPNDLFVRATPRWSPDGSRLVYMRVKPAMDEKPWTGQMMEWSSNQHSEEPLTSVLAGFHTLSDWSADGKSFVFSQGNQETNRFDLWVYPIAARPHVEEAGRRIVSDPAHYLLQSSLSPDEKWIVFEAIQNLPSGLESSVYVAPSGGGPWTRVGTRKQWDDKPRWSPDGKMIYMVSSRAGFFNVFGIHFDPAKGKPIGEPFQVTSFERPSLMLPQNIGGVDLSVAPQWMALTVAQTSGSLWMLENID